MERILKILFCSCTLLMFASCEQFVEIDPPISDLIRVTVFEDDETAERAILGIYTQMANNTSFARGDIRGISFLSSLSSDDLSNFNTSVDIAQFGSNALMSSNAAVLSLWSTLYQAVYRANAVIEGLQNSSKVSPGSKAKLTGEAKFIRAFCHFYLINLWGDAPLILTTDYRINTALPRTPTAEVYKQVVRDLIDAKVLLANTTDNKVRATEKAAIALLARVYLYMKDWANAELCASAMIESSLLLESDPKNVFITTSTEAIWQLASNGINTPEANTFVFATKPINGALTVSLVNAFETGDKRKSNWIGSRMVSGEEYFFPFKYKAASATPVTEYSMVMRLAEQYLIRAEARANQNKIEDAQNDINVIRKRAGLENTNALTQEEILQAIEHERRVEFFTEWGHRWLDLKRTNRIDEINSLIKPDWASTASLYPIPDLQLLNNPSMTNAQNPGY